MSFNWVEGVTTAEYLIRTLTSDILSFNDNGSSWSLEYPNSLNLISDTAIISTTTSSDIKAYVKFHRPENALNYILVCVGSKLTTEGDDIDEYCNTPARFAWYKDTQEVSLFKWASVQYWLSFNQDFINIVMQGDPSLDVAPYNNYLISYAYIGALEGFEGADFDKQYNFGLTVSSDIFPDEENMPQKYGKRTATCITDIGMLGTRTGTPFQAHLPKFSASWEYADKNYITSSQWTHKYHMSDIVICHAYDRERGKLQNVLIGDRSAIFHQDILVIDKGKDTQKEYMMFNINAPYSILNNGPNVLYGLALRKS